jgi:hypothetical protein
MCVKRRISDGCTARRSLNLTAVGSSNYSVLIKVGLHVVKSGCSSPSQSVNVAGGGGGLGHYGRWEVALA